MRRWYVVVNVCRLWCVGRDVMHCILRFIHVIAETFDIMINVVNRQRLLVGDISFLKTKLGSR